MSVKHGIVPNKSTHNSSIHHLFMHIYTENTTSERGLKRFGFQIRLSIEAYPAWSWLHTTSAPTDSISSGALDIWRNLVEISMKFNIIQPLRSPSDPFVLSFQRDPRRLALRGCYWGLWDLESPIKLITSGSFIFLAKWPIFSCHWVSQNFLLSDSIIVGIIIVSQSGTQQ